MSVNIVINLHILFSYAIVSALENARDALYKKLSLVIDVATISLKTMFSY